MLSCLVVFLLIASKEGGAATLETLQSEGDAIYDIGRAIPSLTRVEGTSVRNAIGFRASFPDHYNDQAASIHCFDNRSYLLLAI